jgi:hypothetical protein
MLLHFIAFIMTGVGDDLLIVPSLGKDIPKANLQR